MKFRKKPVVIEAIQLPSKGDYELDEFFRWAEENEFTNFGSGKYETLIIPTLEGDIVVQPLDWIIKGVNGEFYSCKPDIFEKSYEPVSNEIDYFKAGFELGTFDFCNVEQSSDEQ